MDSDEQYLASPILKLERGRKAIDSKPDASVLKQGIPKHSALPVQKT